MRHGQRHLPYAVSTVVGLAAPALAALLLTASTPGLAAVAPAAVEHEVRPHVPTFVSLPTQAPAPRRTAPKPVVHAAAASPVATRSHAPVRHVTTRTTTPRPIAHRTTTSTKTSTTTTKRTSSSTAQPWGTDDYPYKNQSDFYAIDKWGFTERQCVSFAAWRLAQHGRAINNKDSWGSAYQWDDAARRLGYAVTSKARVGEIAQWNAHESGAYYGKGASSPNGKFVAGQYGHVGWVKQVYSDGSALVEQYNMGGDRSYSVMRVKAPRYLVVG